MFARCRRFRWLVSLCFIAAICLLSCEVDAWGLGAQEEFFEQQIRPLLFDHCLSCHDASLQESDLRLDSLDGVLQGGVSGPAAIAGQPSDSLLIHAITGTKGAERMPPDDPLEEPQILLLRRWVKMGLPWTAQEQPAPALGDQEAISAAAKTHWAFRPIAQPTPPNISTGKVADKVNIATWQTNPIDLFVFDQLAAAELAPNPPATRAELAALGFLTVGPQFRNDRLEQVADKIDVIGRGLMGITIACARCHDHKYDPIPIEDYYSLYGVFASCSTPETFPVIDTVRTSAAPVDAEIEADFQRQLDAKKQALLLYKQDLRRAAITDLRRRLPTYLASEFMRHGWSLQGTHVDTQSTDVEELIANIENKFMLHQQQEQQLSLIQQLNRQHLETRPDDEQLTTRIESLEWAFRMRGEAQEAFDLAGETQATREMYGDTLQGRQMLIARRLSERGVRYVQVYHGAGQPWDSHAAIDKNHPRLAGGGVKGGLAYGATDEVGLKAVENRVHVHDLHATMLHLLGFDHTQLTYRYAGRDFRLTDIHGNVVHDIIV